MDLDFVRLQRARAHRVADFIEIGVLLLIAAVCFGSMWASAAEPDAGVAQVIDVERAELVQPNDAGVVLVTGGAWLSDAQLRLTATQLRAKSATPAPATPVVASGTEVAVVVGVAVGIFLAGVGVGCRLGTGNVVCYVPK